MPSAIVTLPDGQRAKVTFDTPDQLDKTVNDLVEAHPVKFGHVDPRTGHTRGVSDVISEAVGEPALKMASGALGAAAGGVAGVARGIGAGAASLAQGEGVEKARQAFTNEATSTIEGVEQAVTREPRTKVGKATSKVAEYPFQLLSKGADIAGRKTAEATGSPALGATVNTALQFAPALVGKALTRGAPVEGVSGEGAPPGPPAGSTDLSASGAPRTAPSEVGAPQAAPPSQAPTPPPGMTATGAPRAPPTDIGGGNVPRGTSGQAPEAAAPPPATATTPEARAQAYAGTLGLDWARLGAGTRKALTTIAQDATALERLNPEAVKRQAHLQSLRVPVQATRGQLERDPVQLRREAIASNTTEGQPIRDLDIAANRDLQANLEVLRGRVGGKRGSLREGITESGETDPTSIRAPTKAPTQVGEAAQTAAREKAKWSKKGYQALYKIARETEPDAKVPVKPVQDLLTENPEIQHLGWVQSWLSKARSVLKPDEAGNAPELTDVKLNELHDLRSKANDIARTGGKEGYYAGQVVKAIDQAMEAAPEGAAAWRRANDAFRKHQQEFKDQGVVSKLVNQKKGGADRALALEKTWKTVATGPLDQIRQVKKTLLTGGTPELRAKGRAAWRDLRAETVNRILEDARNVTSADETERAILTEAALRRSINRIPRENLEELLGKANVRELYNILRARRITTRSPVGGRTTQSGTIPNALTLMEKALKHIPYAKYAVGAKNAVKELGEKGAAIRAAKESTISPLEQAARDVERMSKKRARSAAYATLEQSGPTLPAGAPPQPLPIGPALNTNNQKKPPP
jgi:hypothetical protein